MNLNDLTKEQKQYIVLGLIVGVGVIALSVFGIKLSLSSIGEKQMLLEEVSDKVAKAERALKGARDVSTRFETSVVKLREYQEHMPPTRNYYSWATEIIYSHGKSVGLVIDAVDEMTDPKARKPKDKVFMETYSLRIAAQGGFEEILAFAERLKADQKLLRITGVDISLSQDPEIQIAQIFVQWPLGIEALSKDWNEADTARAQIQKRENDTANVKKGGKDSPASKMS